MTAPPFERLEVTDTVRLPCGGGDAGFTAYVLSVSAAGMQWEVRRRYSAFQALHDQLRLANAGRGVSVPPIPWKSPLGGSNPMVVSHRRQQLQVSGP